jgi:DNA polymerase-1
MRVVCDIETDGLDATKIWCCVCKDLDTGKVTVFRDGDHIPAKAFFRDCTEIIGHNFINFDMQVLNRLWSCNIPLKKVTDTLVLSRLDDAKREKGHSLREWGIALGNYKDHYEDWSQWTQEMEDYCIQDVNVTETVYKHLVPRMLKIPKETIRREHVSQYLLEKQREYGFYFNVEECLKLKAEIDADYMKLLAEIKAEFPPMKKIVRVYTPRYNKDGSMCAVSKRIVSSDAAEDNGDGTYNIIEWVEFDVNSPTQIVERLKPYWHPVIFNKPRADGTCTPKVCPENLETVSEDAPESIQKIVRCKIDTSRSTLLQSFLDATDENGRLHGNVASIGAATHRMAHTKPNTANVPSAGLYGEQIRALFIAPKGYKVVGCDAAGIQLRALASYVGDDDLIHQILHGDIHVYLAKIYGLLPADAVYDESIPEHKKARKVGKTTTYSILMGAGVAKVGQITGKDGRTVMNNLTSGIKGLKKFKDSFRYKAAVGSYKALDGRMVKLKNTHLAMSSHLQSFEQAVVKWVMIEAHKRLTKLGLDFHQVAVVHDEIQYEVREDQAELLATTVAKCFEDAGEYFKTKCPLAGDYKIGNNWSESH